MAAIRSRLQHSLLRFYVNLAAKRDNSYLLSSTSKWRSSYKIDTSPQKTSSISIQPRNACPCHNKHSNYIYRHGSTIISRHYSSNDNNNHDNTSSSSNPHDPYSMVANELSQITSNIKQEFHGASKDLRPVIEYYFDGLGKSFRPMVVFLMSQACNFHHISKSSALNSQNKIAMISEMIHTASLVHDDVIDAADTRRGKPSINVVWGQRKSILAGDYILSVASMALARLQNEQIVTILSQVIEDLVRGEFMQLGSKEDENERFSHYLRKTFKKTASLLANSCKAVSILGNCSEEITEIAYQYGRNIGIAFQLIDDLLDFTSCDSILGKPSAADLKLGLATAPVLFAAQEYPELNPLIMRRFSQDGDVEHARNLVALSNGVQQTRYLAVQHGKEAVRQLRQLRESDSQQALIYLIKNVLDRQK